ncbi:MAG: serine/threonine protein kinase [Planctomycetia bacterium]|nr:serine/threonine protein kinase [Planctomycetia bacterium]
MAGDADRNLLLGILAHQMDFVGRDDLFAAMHAWLLDKERPLGALLVEQGRLSAARRAILEALVDEHVRAHGGVAARSLEAVGPVPGIVDDLGRLADAEVRMSVAHARGEAARSLAREAPAPAAGPDDPWMTRRMASFGAPSAVAGRFRIVRPHAQGGLGIVSVAIDNELDREVAFKEIQPAHADRETSRARFMLEAEFTGKLEHPGIIPIYGLGQDATGRPFYAMRFIRGDSLADAINRFHDSGRGDASGPRAGRELRELLGRFIDVCDAIAYAHSRGVLHRDLKPGNVMLGPYGETMVVDWGLAMPLEQPPADSASPEGLVRPSKADSGSLPSERGAAIGTPLYMPPEQAEGALDRLGPASDVYGLGAILYELLTGRPPVTGTRKSWSGCVAVTSHLPGRSLRRCHRPSRRCASRRWRCAPRTATPRRAAWPPTSRHGWRTSRCRRGASRS